MSANRSEEDLKDIKSLLITYLSDEVVREADKAFEEKGTKDILVKKETFS